jgi:hypothetical protein
MRKIKVKNCSTVADLHQKSPINRDALNNHQRNMLHNIEIQSRKLQEMSRSRVKASNVEVEPLNTDQSMPSLLKKTFKEDEVEGEVRNLTIH